MICDRCGRLLNRATGQCTVCADHGGAAPPPVATTTAAAGPEDLGAADAPRLPRGPSRDPGEPPRSEPVRSEPATPDPAPTTSVAATLRPASPYRLAPAMAPGGGPPAAVEPDRPMPDRPMPDRPMPDRPTPDRPPPSPVPTPPAVAPTPVAAPVVPEVEQPISVSAAVAILDLSDRSERPSRPAPQAPPPPPKPVEPPPPPRTPGAPWGILRGGRMGRRKVDLVAYDGNLVVARRGAPGNLTSGQLAAQDPSSRIVAAEAVEEALVREDAVSGQARIRLRVGDDVVVRWPGWKNRGVSGENLLAHAFPGKVDQGSQEIAKRTVRVMVILGVSILVAVGAYLGLSALLEGDPPPPPPPAPPTTLAPPEQAARTALQQACPAWEQFAVSVAPGDRPDPTALRPVVEGIRPSFVVAGDAGADPLYATARDEVGYLQDYARRPTEDVARESVSRVAFAMRTVSSACDRARAAS